MNKLLIALLAVYSLAGTANQATASGFPGQLDEFCRTAEYIVVAECVQNQTTKAKLKVEEIYKAPKTNTKPDFLDVEGLPTSATRFSFQKGKHYFAFIFAGGRCDSQGSHLEIDKDGKLKNVRDYHTNELICLEKNTDTIDKLTKQVKRVLSGEYEKELIANIKNKKLSNDRRCEDAMALCRTNPSVAIGVLSNLLSEIIQNNEMSGSSTHAFRKLLELNPNQAKELSLQILSNSSTSASYSYAAEMLANPQCKLENLNKHYPKLVKAAHELEKINPNYGYVHMLPVFINNDCRSPEVKNMLLAELSSPRCNYLDLILQSAIKLQFSESVPLFWEKIKKGRLTSNLTNLDFFIASYVEASSVYSREKYEKLEVWMGINLVRSAFPEYTEIIADAEVIRVGKSLLFLIRLDGGQKHRCLYVGFERIDEKNFKHKVFVLFDGE